ncbi:DUF861 domain-containing protein [Gordonia sp. TBRC 11910]|uniref:DUF861 domain-containing protein n=1 Tax=Gordonia asplenii TaxID=2725283 RepID=A0A848L3M9_9ACTN|nr:cupin domain-containing protein [Gordonia asplenii]NMO02248.1 DUF861 domain-containing protein [Gordonia asplenii]
MPDPIITGSADETALVPMSPEEGGWEPVEGDPAAIAHDYVKNEGMWSGLIVYQPCSVRETVANYSSIQVLSGQLILTDENGVTELGAGDLAFFSPGQNVTFTAKTEVREIYTVCGPFEA